MKCWLIYLTSLLLVCFFFLFIFFFFKKKLTWSYFDLYLLHAIFKKE